MANFHLLKIADGWMEAEGIRNKKILDINNNCLILTNFVNIRTNYYVLILQDNWIMYVEVYRELSG